VCHLPPLTGLARSLPCHLLPACAALTAAVLAITAKVAQRLVGVPVLRSYVALSPPGPVRPRPFSPHPRRV